LEEHAGKDVRQEEHLSALSAFDGFFGAWEITHGKPPPTLSNPPSEGFRDAFSGQFFVSRRENRGMLVSIGYGVRACLGFQTGVRDFRREAGAWNMVVGFTSKMQLARFVTLFGIRIRYDNDHQW
jgi:hypothetical protein